MRELRKSIKNFTEVFGNNIEDYTEEIPTLYERLLCRVRWLEGRKYDLDEGHYYAYQMYAQSAGDVLVMLHRDARYAQKGYLDTEKKQHKAVRHAATAQALLQQMMLLVLEDSAQRAETNSHGPGLTR